MSARLLLSRPPSACRPSSSVCLHGLPSVHVCVPSSSSHKEASHGGLGSTPVTAGELPLQTPHQQIQSQPEVLEVRTPTDKFGGIQLNP